MPDATYGYVRSLTASDLREVGLPILMMNAFHLMQNRVPPLSQPWEVCTKWQLGLVLS